MAVYKLKLYKYTHITGFEEQTVLAPFNPEKVGGFGVVRNTPKSGRAKMVAGKGIKEGGLCQKVLD